jgi:hypothetical protein
LRLNPSCAIVRRTASAVSGRTPGSSFTTRETVFTLTPAASATSLIVGRGLRPFVLPRVFASAASYAAAATAPVIIPTMASRLVSLLSRVATVRPWRSTVIRSATAKTSGRLWLIMITASP